MTEDVSRQRFKIHESTALVPSTPATETAATTMTALSTLGDTRHGTSAGADGPALPPWIKMLNEIVDNIVSRHVRLSMTVPARSPNALTPIAL